MKLLIYSHFFAPSVGGVETIVQSLARGLAELQNRAGGAEFEIALVTQTAAGNFDDTAFPFRVIRQPGLLQLWQLIRQSDIVHAAGPALPPLLLSFLAGKIFVIQHHGFQTICPNGQLFVEPDGVPCPGHFMAARHLECLRCNSGQGWITSHKLWLFTFLRRFLCLRAGSNICPTQWLAGMLQLPRSNAIPHGVELQYPSSVREPVSSAPIIAFLGRLVTTKGVRLLVEAGGILLAQNRAFQLLIIGDGPERDSLKQFARTLRLDAQVRFAGRLDGPQLEAALAQAHVLVVPSLGGEVFGLALAESMLRGLPTVASDLGAFIEVLGEAGLTFRTGDATELAARLKQILDDRALAARLSQAGRQRVLNAFSPKRMIDAHAELYCSLHRGAAAEFDRPS